MRVFGGLGYLLVDRRARRDGRRQERHSRFAEVLQLARSEDEAYTVVKKHLEKLVPGSRATVLGRNNSANRLEPRTQVEGTVLDESLDGAEPEACIAIRGGKPHQSSEADELMACEVCGEVVGKTTCVPALVGGEVIGSVLIEHPRALINGDSDAVSASITESAPIVANLRNLAIAELRAATDALTGLPNNRSIQETLKRMSAQAGRTLSPLAVVLFDLDHFKQVNDSHGHSKGDEVLAVVSDTVASRLRASDFVGRYGGEEFLALLPDTGREDALALAEILREAVFEIDVPGVTQSISASFGVAVMPDEAGEPAEIVRVADRALYTAKSLGRNRVATAVDSTVAAVATGERHAALDPPALDRLPGPMSLTVVGSIAFDAVKSPFGEREKMLGGAAVHFSLAASFFTDVRVVGPVGDDFGDAEYGVLRNRGVITDDIEHVEGGDTFFWKAHYEFDMNTAHTEDTQLGVFGEFEPKLSEDSKNSDVLFLANIQPDVQRGVLEQSQARFSGLDSMNLWIETARDSLVKTIGGVDLLFLNDAELRMLTEEANLVKAARAVMEMGPSTVVAKQGEYGAALFTEEGFFALPAYPLETVVDPTGAGDSFAGGFLGYLGSRSDASDEELRRAMVYGSTLASFNVEEFGTERVSRLTREEIDERYSEFERMTALAGLPA